MIVFAGVAIVAVYLIFRFAYGRIAGRDALARINPEATEAGKKKAILVGILIALVVCVALFIATTRFN
jgi:hypothetical protein